jgi:hypothetical protein
MKISKKLFKSITQKLPAIAKRKLTFMLIASIMLAGITTVVLAANKASNIQNINTTKVEQKKKEDSKVATNQSKAAAPTEPTKPDVQTQQQPAAVPNKSTPTPKSATTPTLPPVNKQPATPNNKPLSIFSVYLLPRTPQCTGGNGVMGYGATFYLNDYNAGGAISGSLEIVSGSATLPAFSTFSVAPGSRHGYAEVPAASGLPLRYAAYDVRLHVTAPANLYSNTITVPACGL